MVAERLVEAVGRALEVEARHLVEAAEAAQGPQAVEAAAESQASDAIGSMSDFRSPKNAPPLQIGDRLTKKC